MSEDSEVVFSCNKITASGNYKANIENQSPQIVGSIKRNLFKSGSLGDKSDEKERRGSSQKSGRKPLSEITNELKAKKIEN